MTTAQQTALATAPQEQPGLARAKVIDIVGRLVISNDLKSLTPEDRVRYYWAYCEHLGLDPVTRPFGYILFKARGDEPERLALYALKECTDQLRRIRGISVRLAARETVEVAGNLVLVQTAQATDAQGRTDEDVGSVTLREGTKAPYASVLANAFMKAATKAKRRVTLAICGLSMLDESELDGVPDARTIAAAEAERLPALDAHDEPDPATLPPSVRATRMLEALAACANVKAFDALVAEMAPAALQLPEDIRTDFRAKVVTLRKPLYEAAKSEWEARQAAKREPDPEPVATDTPEQAAKRAELAAAFRERGPSAAPPDEFTGREPGDDGPSPEDETAALALVPVGAPEETAEALTARFAKVLRTKAWQTASPTVQALAKANVESWIATLTEGK